MIPESLGTLAAFVSLDASGIAAGAQTAIRELQGFSAKLRSAGLSNIVVGLSIGLPLKKAITEAAAFGKQMAFVSTMLDDAGKWMPTYTAGIKAMSVQFGDSTAALSKGLYDILSASFPPEQAMYLLEQSVKAAKGGMTDAAVSVDAMTTVLNAYGKSAAEAGDLADWFFMVVKRGKTTYPELAASIGMVATTASVAGVSLNEMGAAIATMTRVGVSTTHAVTSLNAIISSFLKPTDEAAEYARTLGFEMSSATIKAKGLKWVFDQIGKLPPDAIAKLFPNVRALRGVLPALQNMAGFEYDIGMMAARAGASGDAFNKMTKDMYFYLARAGEMLKEISVAIGDALAPSLESLSEVFIGAGHSVVAWINNNQWLVKTLAVVSATLLASGAAMLIVSGAISIVTSLWGVFAGAIGAVVAVIGFLLSPVGLVIAAIVAMGAAVISVVGHGDTFLQKLQDIASRVWDALVPALYAIKDAFVAVWDNYLAPAWQAMQALATAVFTAVGEMIVSVWTGVIVPIFTWAAATIEGIWTSIWSWIGPYVSTAFNWVKDFLKTALDVIIFSFQNWKLVCELAVTTWALAVVSSFWTVVHAIQQIPTILLWVADNWKEILQTMWNGIKAFVSNVGTNLANLGKAIWGALKGEGWNFEWTGLLDGFESAIKEMPKIAEREIGPMEAALNTQVGDLTTQLGQKWAEHAAEQAAAAAQLPAREAAKAAAAAAPYVNGIGKQTPAAEAAAPGTGAGVADKPALAKMAERGSAEAYSAIVSAGKDTAATTAKNTTEMVAQQKQTNRQLAAMAGSQPETVDLGLEE